MFFQKTRKRIQSALQDSVADALNKALLSKQKSSRLSRLCENVHAHSLAIATLIKMEPKMARKAKEILRR